MIQEILTKSNVHDQDYRHAKKRLFPSFLASNYKHMKNRRIKTGLLLLFSFIIGFHLLVISGIIPYENVWGGRLKNQKEMLLFETLSIVLNALFMVVVLVKSRYLKLNISPKIITVLLWIMTFLFTLNTIGNLFAVNNLEQYIATPITLLLGILCFMLARERP